MKLLRTNKLLLLSLLLLSSQLAGCFVSLPGDDQYYDYLLIQPYVYLYPYLCMY